jgi:hypothetical protein
MWRKLLVQEEKKVEDKQGKETVKENCENIVPEFKL